MWGDRGSCNELKAAAERHIRQEECMTELLTEQQAAGLLHMSVKGLQGWRSRGGGPPFCKVGRCVRYRLEDLQAFVLAALRTSTSDPGPTRADQLGIRVGPMRVTTRRAQTPASSSGPPHPGSQGEVRRVPTPRRHRFPPIRCRTRILFFHQSVDGSKPRPAR